MSIFLIKTIFYINTKIDKGTMKIMNIFYVHTEVSLFDWFVQRRDLSVPINGPILKKAKHFPDQTWPQIGLKLIKVDRTIGTMLFFIKRVG